MEIAQDQTAQSDHYFRDLAILDWLVELGATEAISETGINRYDLPETVKQADKPVAPSALKKSVMSLPDTEQLAALCTDIEMLRKTVVEFDGCSLKKGARNTVFSDGNPAARVMVIGDTPDPDEDRNGTVFAGKAGNLLDKMFTAIGLSRQAETGENAIYMTCISPWRTPQNRDLSTDEIALLKPFLIRHVLLAKPEFIVVMGSQPAKILLGFEKSITHHRGQWGQLAGISTLAMFSPANLLRNPLNKRAAWADLLALDTRLKPGPHD